MHTRYLRNVQQSRLDTLAQEHRELYSRFDDLRLLAVTLTIPTVYGFAGLGNAAGDSPGMACGIAAAVTLSYVLGRSMCSGVQARMADVRRQMRECQEELNLLYRSDV